MSKIVERTLDFLELFAEEKRPLSLSEISRLLNIPVSSCHDVLQAMQERGYLYELAPRGGYYPTLRLHELGKTFTDHDPVVLRADAMLRNLRDLVDESVFLSKVNGLKAIYLLSFEPAHPLAFRARIGDEIKSLHGTSAGKALLASLDRKTLDNFLKTTKLAPLTPKTITSKAALLQQIGTGRQKKWFLNREESIDGVLALSSSFVWNTATFIVTIAGPIARLEPRIEWVAGALVDVTERLEMRTSVDFEDPAKA